MAGQRIDMMEIRALIRLKQKNLSNRKAAQALGVDRKTVDAYISRFKALDLSYEELSTLDEKDLLELFTVESQTEKERYEELAVEFEKLKRSLLPLDVLFSICMKNTLVKTLRVTAIRNSACIFATGWPKQSRAVN